MGGFLALLISLASLAMGALAGFLFGIPRSLSGDHSESQNQARSSADAAADPSSSQSSQSQSAAPRRSTVNTNLEKISDWLTTIIVGVGLTNLPGIPSRLDAYGDNVNGYFGFGGKVFAIAAGLYFLVVGFFLFYVLTRVKLSLVFAYSDEENLYAAAASKGVFEANVKVANEAPPIPSMTAGVASAPLTPEQEATLKQADAQLLSKSLTDLKSTDEIIAWGNAKARQGDFQAALTGYQDVLKRVPPSAKLLTDYAAVLAAAGDRGGADSVLASLQATTGLSADAEREARLKIDAASQTATALALRSRLQQGLYRNAEKGYEDSIQAGEELLKRPEPVTDAMTHVWLAAAYGQKHAALSAKASPSEAEKREMRGLRESVVIHVKRAIELDPSVKLILQGMYDNRYRVGDDDDLDSLKGDPELNTILLDAPAETN